MNVGLTGALSRITYFSTLVGIDSYNEKIHHYGWDGGIFRQSGGFDMPLVGPAAMVRLTNYDFAFIDSNVHMLTLLRWSGSSWSVIGDRLSVEIGAPSIARLSNNSIALSGAAYDGGKVSMFRHTGSIWELYGTDLIITGLEDNAMCQLSSSQIAICDASHDTLSAYDYNGSELALAGSAYSLSHSEYSAISALNSTDIAFINTALDSLTTYRFNGSTWSPIGNSLSITGLATGITMVAYNSTDVAVWDGGTNTLRSYRFDGTDWSLIGSALLISGTAYSPALAVL